MALTAIAGWNGDALQVVKKDGSFIEFVPNCDVMKAVEFHRVRHGGGGASASESLGIWKQMTILMFLLAFTMPFEVNLGGRLMVADILCVGICGAALLGGWFPPVSTVERKFYIFATVWLFVRVLTDLYLGIPVEQFSRGWSVVIFFIINYTAVRVVTGGNIGNASFFLLLVSVGAAIKFYLGTGSVEKTGILSLDWRFGYGMAFTMVFMYAGLKLSHMRGLGGFASFLPVGAAVVNLLMSARSLFGQSAIAALIGLATTGRSRRRMSTSALVLLTALGLGSGWGVIEVYTYAASEGMLGREAWEKYERQAENDLGLLLGGRTELLASIEAISDSPIVGYGSYARNLYYAMLRRVRLQQAGIPISKELEDDRIPTHSFLFGAWVETGIVGALFWGWLLWVTLGGAFRTIQSPTAYTTIVLFAAVSLGWDILFSPFGLDRRIVTPVLLNIMMAVIASSATAGGTDSAPQSELGSGGSARDFHRAFPRPNAPGRMVRRR